MVTERLRTGNVSELLVAGSQHQQTPIIQGCVTYTKLPQPSALNRQPLVSLGNDTTPSAPSLVHYLSRAFQVGPHRFFLTLENETVKGSLGVKRCSLSAVRPRIKVVRGRHELSSRLGVRVIGLLPSQHIPLLSLLVTV